MQTCGDSFAIPEKLTSKTHTFGKSKPLRLIQNSSLNDSEARILNYIPVEQSLLVVPELFILPAFTTI